MTFEEAWAQKVADGYQYGGDALDNVRFGWELAQEEIAYAKSEQDRFRNRAVAEQERANTAERRIHWMREEHEIVRKRFLEQNAGAIRGVTRMHKKLKAATGLLSRINQRVYKLLVPRAEEDVDDHDCYACNETMNVEGDEGEYMLCNDCAQKTCMEIAAMLK